MDAMNRTSVLDAARLQDFTRYLDVNGVTEELAFSFSKFKDDASIRLTFSDGVPLLSNRAYRHENFLSAYFDQIQASVSFEFEDDEPGIVTWRQNSQSYKLRQSSLAESENVQRTEEAWHIAHQELVTPDMVTVLPTYRCNAACEQCCFESNPGITHRLSRETLFARLNQSIDSFPNLQIVIFSGGECFLLGDDLYDAINLLSSRGIKSRCVSNGFWGRSKKSAEKVAGKLIEAGIWEMNLSTGRDHQKWVPVEHVVNAAEVLVGAGITTLVTVESESEVDTDASAECDIVEDSKFLNDERIQVMLSEDTNMFSVRVNTWMSMHDDSAGRGNITQEAISGGCDQLFHNFVITPHDMASACCGLTLEHIPELKLAQLSDDSDLDAIYKSQLNDFLKIWIHMDGPMGIMRELFDADEVNQTLASVNHICQACAILHKHEGVKAALRERYMEYVPEVLARFNLKQSVRMSLD